MKLRPLKILVFSTTSPPFFIGCQESYWKKHFEKKDCISRYEVKIGFSYETVVYLYVNYVFCIVLCEQ